MAAFEKKYVVTAIGANSVTLTPFLGAGGAGSAPVSGTLPTSDPENSGGHSTLVLNYTGTPDAKLWKTVGDIVNVEIGADSV